MNVELLRKVIDYLSSPEVVLGVKRLLNKDGSPCDALGHMAVVAGIDVKPTFNEGDYYVQIRRTYGYDLFDTLHIWYANDNSKTEDERKANVINVLGCMVNGEKWTYEMMIRL
jgi:hypothetical protein